MLPGITSFPSNNKIHSPSFIKNYVVDGIPIYVLDVIDMSCPNKYFYQYKFNKLNISLN